MQTTPSPTSAPIPAFHDQDAVFARAFELLRRATEARAFPGAALAVTRGGELLALHSVGRFAYEPDAPPVTPQTVYDLASLSKVVATTTMAMLLYERGQLQLNMPVTEVLPEFSAASDPANDRKAAPVSFRMLLAHSSGLPAYARLFERARTRDELLAAAFSTPLEADPDTRAAYSDIGFILLGVALERIAGGPLDKFCAREVFQPLGMRDTQYRPPPELRPRIPPTADDRTFRHRVVQGEVQDENASVMGEVAGHAGVFASAEDVARFACCMLNGGQPILRPQTVALFTARQPHPPGAGRALGWDTPSHPSQSGQHFSPNSFGHLGYTGTSLWIDPQRHVSITLLTNRTWPDCGSQEIKTVRPAFHDAVMEALDKLK